jgi:hypothetical protein
MRHAPRETIIGISVCAITTRLGPKTALGLGVVDVHQRKFITTDSEETLTDFYIGNCTGYSR